MRIPLSILAAAFIALATFSAHAASRPNGTHLISLGAGIAAPSDTSAILENPAGFVYERELKLLATGTDDASSPTPATVGAGAFFGKDWIGGALKYDYDRSASQSNLSAGIAIDISRIDTSIGLACGMGLGSSISISCHRFGLIYAPHGKLRFGAELNTGAAPTAGAGVAAELTHGVEVALDGSVHTSGNGASAKPGLIAKIAPVELAIGYGIHADGGASMINSGLSVGFGVDIGRNLQIQAYYNQLARYFVGLAYVL